MATVATCTRSTARGEGGIQCYPSGNVNFNVNDDPWSSSRRARQSIHIHVLHDPCHVYGWGLGGAGLGGSLSPSFISTYYGHEPLCPPPPPSITVSMHQCNSISKASVRTDILNWKPHRGISITWISKWTEIHQSYTTQWTVNTLVTQMVQTRCSIVTP